MDWHLQTHLTSQQNKTISLEPWVLWNAFMLTFKLMIVACGCYWVQVNVVLTGEKPSRHETQQLWWICKKKLNRGSPSSALSCPLTSGILYHIWEDVNLSCEFLVCQLRLETVSYIVLVLARSDFQVFQFLLIWIKWLYDYFFHTSVEILLPFKCFHSQFVNANQNSNENLALVCSKCLAC